MNVTPIGELIKRCKDYSGFCHVLSVDKVTRNRVYVTYSNPDEYGRERPVTVLLPAYRSNGEVWVVLHPIRAVGGTSEDRDYFLNGFIDMLLNGD